MREFWFESGGIRLFGMEDGEGPVVVMLHGGMADHRAALPFVAPLSERYRIIVPDQRGSGKSHSPHPLTFEKLADDVGALLEHLDVDTAVVGGVSSGTGVALSFALNCPSQLLGLVIVTPIYAGTESGYTKQQEKTFAMMDALASRAPDEGVQVLRPLYENLPVPMREKALAMVEEFDGPSVAATSRFIASGAQPFSAPADLESLEVPTLLIRGDDPIHLSEVSDIYERSLPNCRAMPASTKDIPMAIGAFCDDVVNAR